MAKKRDRDAGDISKTQVRLKPMFGMEPGLYLTILYAALLAIVVFLVLFLPGISDGGSSVEVTSSPGIAAVYVDNRYVGATPLRVYVREGERTIRIEKPFYTPVRTKVAVEGRLFGSLLFPRTMTLDFPLTVSDLDGLLKSAFATLSEWALVDTVVPNYQLPPVLTDTVRGAERSVGFTDGGELVRFLHSAARDVHNVYLLRDFLSAEGYLYSGGGTLTEGSLLAMLSGFASAVRADPNLVFWVYDSLDKEAQTSVALKPWFQDFENSYLASLEEQAGSTEPSSAPRVDVDGVRFIPVPSGSYIEGLPVGVTPVSPVAMGFALPHRERVAGFAMGVTDVTYAQYGRFLSENPKWLPEKRGRLVAAGLATADYLKDWDVEKDSSKPVAYVSSYAARAYCDWLSAKLPFPGWKVRLPTEAEWEMAARMGVDPRTSVFHETASSAQPVGSGSANSLGIYDLLGNVWEWTSDWYFPADYVLSSWTGAARYETKPFGDGAEVSVRGGSFASSWVNVSYVTRGSQPPTWCTPFLGFRPVLVRN